MSERAVVRAPPTKRVRRSVLRYTVLVGSAFLLAVPAAYLTSTGMHVSYTAEGRLWAEDACRRVFCDSVVGTPMVSRSNTWIDLLQSSAVLYPVALDGQITIRSPGGDAVASPRDAVRVLSQSLMISIDRDGHVMRVALEDADPREAARIVNAVMESAIEVVATEQQGRRDQQLAILEEQIEQAKLELRQAEQDLEEFRARTANASSHRTSRLDDEQRTEARLRTRVQVAESIVSELGRSVERATLAAASPAPPLLRLLDRASVPDRPSRDNRILTVALVLLFCLALVAGGGLVLGRMAIGESPGL